MSKMKKLLVMLMAVAFITACGDVATESNPNTDNGNNGSGGGIEVPTDPKELIGSIWAGNWEIGKGVSVAVRIKDDKSIYADYCAEALAIQNVTKGKEGGWGQTLIEYTYTKQGDKYIVTQDISNGSRMNLKEFYIENDKLVLIDQRDVELGRLTLRSLASDDKSKEYIFNEINKYRQANGKNVIQWNGNKWVSCEKAVADKRVIEIEEKFSHDRPSGTLQGIFDEIGEVCKQRPYSFGEILAQQSSPEKAMEAWKQSEGHSGVMLGDFNWAAVAKNGSYYVVFFGKR